MSRYIPNLATLNKPLRDLSKQQKFEWNTSHKEAKRGIQNAISKNLSYFDPEAKEIKVITDASQHGLGAQLSRDGATVAFASRSLSETEQRCSQMEKEMLAITFACKRFHQYLFGRTICVTTDHKPLESIFGKSIQRTPPRLQRMMLAIQPYDIKLRYKPGKTIPVADTLSRLHLADTDIESQVDMEILVHSVLQTVPIASQRLAQIRKETTKDETLNSLLETIQVGWPNNKKSLDRKLGPFWSYRHELAELDGLVVKGERIVIPRSMRAGILGQLHSSHLGVAKTKERARTSVFWPGITRDIERLVNYCEVCAKFAMNQQKEPMILHKIPDYPFQHVAADLFQLNGQDYMVTVDYMSRFFEVDRLTNTTSRQVINKLKYHFVRYGIPKRLTTDNGSVTDVHDCASCQVETSSVSPSKNVPDPLADSQETTDPPTVESPTPKQGVTNKEVEATDRLRQSRLTMEEGRWQLVLVVR